MVVCVCVWKVWLNEVNIDKAPCNVNEAEDALESVLCSGSRRDLIIECIVYSLVVLAVTSLYSASH